MSDHLGELVQERLLGKLNSLLEANPDPVLLLPVKLRRDSDQIIRRFDVGIVPGNAKGQGNRDAARFDRLPRSARRQERSGRAEVYLGPESSPRTWTDAGPELSRVAGPNPAFVGGCRHEVLTCFGLIAPKHLSER